MAKKKQLYFNKVTQQGQEDNMCPNCDGDAVFIGDCEDGSNDLDIEPCTLCNATGIAILDKDYKINVEYTENGPIHQIVALFKDK